MARIPSPLVPRDPPAGKLLVTLLICFIPIARPSLGLAQVKVLVEAAGAVEAEAEDEEMIIDAGFEIAESNFDQWIFGAQYRDQALERLESLLALKIDAIKRVAGLADAQVEKLQLAGQGDLKRFYDDVAVVRAKFMKVRRNRNGFNQIWQDIQPLQTKINAGLFEQASLLNKVVKRTLDDEQSARLDEAERNRIQFRYRARLALMVAMMERNMPLRAEQRERLIQTLIEETQPPRAFGQYDYYLVLYQLGKVPEEKLRPIFDEPQWKVLRKFAAQGLAMEAFLKQQKVLP